MAITSTVCMDRITAKATPEGTLNYTYDAAGHVASISSGNTNGASMSYTYDDLDRGGWPRSR